MLASSFFVVHISICQTAACVWPMWHLSTSPAQAGRRPGAVKSCSTSFLTSGHHGSMKATVTDLKGRVEKLSPMESPKEARNDFTLLSNYSESLDRPVYHGVKSAFWHDVHHPHMCHLTHVICHVSPVRCQMSGVRCHMSHFTCHVLCVTCHIFFIKRNEIKKKSDQVLKLFSGG